MPINLTGMNNAFFFKYKESDSIQRVLNTKFHVTLLVQYRDNITLSLQFTFKRVNEDEGKSVRETAKEKERGGERKERESESER